jgi:DNA-directed RNA polymerase subunit RPC12/RpoP
MPTITGFKCVDKSGFPILCDAFGNNVAIRCPSCSTPILVIARKNQRGSDPTHVSTCVACKLRIWIKVYEKKRLLIVHQIKENLSAIDL